MKTNPLLLLACLVVLASTVSAASNQTDTHVLVLPTYEVTAPRDQAVEQRIQTRLDEFRQQALTPLAIVPELNLLNGHPSPTAKLANASRSPAAAGAAKS